MDIRRRIGDLLRRAGGPVPAPPAFRPSPEPADVVACYRLLLDREPDPGDLTALTTAIAAGWSLETLVRSILCSQEFRTRRWVEILQAGAAPPGTPSSGPGAGAGDLAACYRFVLGRPPDPAGWAGHLRAIRGGTGRDALLCGFLLCPEFQRRPLARALKAPAARPVTMKLGFPFAVYENDDAIGAEFRRTGEFEPHVTRHFLERVRPGDVVLDIGANTGYFTVLAGRAVGPQGAVFAFEPFPANVALIHANVLLNTLGNVRVYPFALAERWSCFAAYAVDTNAGLLGFEGEALALPGRDVVSAARLDDLLAGTARVDVIKIDVEGFEYRALSGGAALLARHRPIIFTELLPEALRMASGVAPDKYLAFIAGLGYALAVIREDGTLLDCGADPGRALATIGERGGHADLLAVPNR